MRIVKFILLANFLYNCQTQGPVETMEFEIVELKGAPISVESTDLLDPAQLIIIDTLLIVKNTSFAEFQFTIINLNSGKILKNFGTRGRGPGEQVSSFMFTKSKSPRCFESYSPNQLQAQKVNIDSVIKGNLTYHEIIGSFKANKNKNDPENFFWPLKVRCFNNNLFITCDFYNNNRVLGLSDNQGQLQGTYLYYPDEKDLPPHVKKMKLLVYSSQIEVHPKENRFAYTSSYSDWLVIGEVSDEGIKVLYNKYSYLPKYYIKDGRELKIDRNSILGNFNLTASNNYVFIQRSDKTINESIVGRRIDKSDSLIYSYDWDGKPKYILQLNQKIVAYAIDENTKVLYAISNIPEPVILRYDISAIL